MLFERILVAEDDGDLRLALADNFNSLFHYEVIQAEDGKQAVAKFISQRPGLMILDLLLPKLSGFGVLEQLRQQDRLKDTPVIVYSNLARPEDIQKARELQVTDYYVKSQIAVEDLCLRAQKLLAEKSITDENRNLRLNSLDVSREFKAMNYLSFKDFLKEKEGEMGMIIRAELTGNVADNNAMLLSLQQFLNGATTIGQKRYAVVKTSEEEHEKYISAFNSGIIWEKE